eukprot:3005649-Alexandrium_andersonii.AAC.1
MLVICATLRSQPHLVASIVELLLRLPRFLTLWSPDTHQDMHAHRGFGGPEKSETCRQLDWIFDMPSAFWPYTKLPTSDNNPTSGNLLGRLS